MASNGFYGALQLLHGANYNPPAPSTLTLVITSGAVTLINRGTTAVTVTDGTNPVTGCTLIISDGTKGSTVAQNVTGKAESGTFTVTASKAGYTNSSPVTFTCSGGLILDLNAALGTNTTTNGASVTSWTDQSTTALAFTEATNPPIYLASGLNAAPAIRFNGTSQLLSTASNNAPINPVSYAFFGGIQTSSDGGASNRSVFGNLSAANTGYNVLINTTNQYRWAVGIGSGSAALSGGSILAASGHYLTGTFDNGTTTQTARADGTSTGSQSTANVQNTTTVCRVGTNNAGSGNFFPGDIYRILLYNRAPTAPEITQAELTIKTLMGL